VKIWVRDVAVSIVAVVGIVLIFTSTGQLRIFWHHLRTDSEEDQFTVDHYTYADFSRGTTPKPMAACDVYFGQFGGQDVGHSFTLLSLPKECASEQYLIHDNQILVPDKRIWTAGPIAIWWRPDRLHELPVTRPEQRPSFDGGPAGFVYFYSPSCGPIRATE
jgi:hypothetical protein